MPEKNNSNTQIDWESIMSTINDGKCVLLIGPEIFSDSTTSFNDKMSSFLNEQLHLERKHQIIEYYQRHDLFDFADDSEYGIVYQKLKIFYSQLKVSDLYEKIAQLPIPLKITLNPDDVLKKECSKYNRNYAHYSKKPNIDETEVRDLPKKNIPLIYNLFGTLNKQITLILTYDDLLDYIFALLGKIPDFPLNVRNILGEAENFLFIGFRFDHWYMQLLIKILTSQGDTKGKIKYALENSKVSKESYIFYAHHFKLKFTSLTPSEFINELYDKCKGSNILLKEQSLKSFQDIKEELDALLEEDNLGDIVVLLKEHFKNRGELFENEYDTCIILSASLNTLIKNEIEGILDVDDVRIQRAKLRKSLRDLMKSVNNN